ncbi:MAG TPA: energy transducer TonB [Candidatus Solibacter sp.]|nr:energy transducer TonB [Candidatus Solibacter sp.]
MSRPARPFGDFAVLLSLALFACAPPLAARSSDPKLDALAGDLAGAIRQNLSSPPSKHHEVTYLVFDIAESNGEVTRLGLQLADDLAEALRNRSPGLKPLDRASLRDLIDRDRLDPAAFQSDPVAHWAARTLEANLAIVGSLDTEGNGIELRIHVIGRDPKKRVTELTAHLDWNPDRRALQGRIPLPRPSTASWKDVPVAGQSKYSIPKCADCPQPSYSDPARLARVQGRALAQVLLGKDGRVQDVALIRGLPCGLSKRVVTMLMLWRFQPVTDARGEPAVVQFPVEVTFRLM